ncbi:hypothetical protein HDU97_007228 [Phlyctochytrium planicorne]|nr:hypothetical protein HDU97_007228 [Phlyctochytrium planicorne]
MPKGSKPSAHESTARTNDQHWLDELLQSVSSQSHASRTLSDMDINTTLAHDFNFMLNGLTEAPMIPNINASSTLVQRESISTLIQSDGNTAISSPSSIQSYSSSPNLKLDSEMDRIHTKHGDSGSEMLAPVNLSKSSISRQFDCTACSTPLGLLLQYGTKTELEESIVVDFTCIPCSGISIKNENSTQPDEDESSQKQNSNSKRKRGRGKSFHSPKERLVACQACNKDFSVGCAKARLDLSNPLRSGDFAEPKSGLEHICKNCVYNFNFCSTCGGGSNFRTGKWRPRQLFAHGRRTCNLPHERLGPIVQDFKVTTYHCPIEETPDFDPEPMVMYSNPELELLDKASSNPPGMEMLKKRRDDFMPVLFGRNLGYWATASAMATHEATIGTYEKLMERMNYMKDYLEVLMCGINPSKLGQTSSLPTSDVTSRQLRRYLVASDAAGDVRETGSSGKKKSKLPPSPSTISMEGGQKSQRCLTWTFHGNLCMEWNVINRTVGLVYEWYPGKDSVGDGFNLKLVEEPKRIGPLDAMVLSIVQRISRDANVYQLDTPIHLWARILKAEIPRRPRETVEYERVGMMPLEQYASANGIPIENLLTICRGSLAPYERVEDFLYYVMNWQTMLSRFT